MQNYKLTIAYDGTNYCGWQIQSKGERTIQGELTRACLNIFHTNVSIHGSGRTDSGVHASGQVAHVKLNSSLTPDVIQRAINSKLNFDIRVLSVEPVPAEFHAQQDAMSKQYCYTIDTLDIPDVFSRNYSYHYPHKLNLSILQSEASCLLGEHDFALFRAIDPSKRTQSTVRCLHKALIEKKESKIYLTFAADGFLYKMVRILTGTLLLIASGKLPKGTVLSRLQNLNQSPLVWTAPAHGLCLQKVEY